MINNDNIPKEIFYDNNKAELVDYATCGIVI